MTVHAAIAADSDAPSARELARGQIEAQVTALAELAEIGMVLARRLGEAPEQAAAKPDQPPPADPILAFDRISRAIRHTFALQSRLIADLQTLEEGGRLQPQDPAARRKQAVCNVVRGVVRQQYRSWGVREVVAAMDRLLPEAAERLEHETLYGDIAARPMSEIVADICRDLGLKPDWAGLSQHLWAREEIDSGQIGTPLSLDGGRAGQEGEPANGPGSGAETPAPPASPPISSA